MRVKYGLIYVYGIFIVYLSYIYSIFMVCCGMLESCLWLWYVISVGLLGVDN